MFNHNETLNQFDTSLLRAFYERNEDREQAELIKDDLFPDLVPLVLLKIIKLKI